MAIRDCYILKCELVTRASMERTFKVFENPRNLAAITPPWLNFRILTQDLEMRRGALIDYKLSWAGLPMYWRTLITAYEPPHCFVDEQLRGPYTLWRHRHTFRETPEGVLVGDEVRYILPLGPLGRIAHAAVVKRQLTGIFQYRQRALGAILGQIVSAKDPSIERGEVDTTRPELREEIASPEVHTREA